jgi:hypothetical protein
MNTYQFFMILKDKSVFSGSLEFKGHTAALLLKTQFSI